MRDSLLCRARTDVTACPDPLSVANARSRTISCGATRPALALPTKLLPSTEPSAATESWWCPKGGGDWRGGWRWRRWGGEVRGEAEGEAVPEADESECEAAVADRGDKYVGMRACVGDSPSLCTCMRDLNMPSATVLGPGGLVSMGGGMVGGGSGGGDGDGWPRESADGDWGGGGGSGGGEGVGCRRWPASSMLGAAPSPLLAAPTSGIDCASMLASGSSVASAPPAAPSCLPANSGKLSDRSPSEYSLDRRPAAAFPWRRTKWCSAERHPGSATNDDSCLPASTEESLSLEEPRFS